MRMLFGLHVSYIVVIQMIYLYVLHSMSQKHLFVCLFVCLPALCRLKCLWNYGMSLDVSVYQCPWPSMESASYWTQDLCTDCETVQDKMAGYLSHLQDLGVAGVRLDAAKHIPREDLAKIFATLGVFKGKYCRFFTHSRYCTLAFKKVPEVSCTTVFSGALFRFSRRPGVQYVWHESWRWTTLSLNFLRDCVKESEGRSLTTL